MAGHQGRLAACEGKRSFPDYALAVAVRNRMRRRRKRRLAVYRCRYCHDWHIGTNTRVFKDQADDGEDGDSSDDLLTD